jgi:hypothetical protein
VHPGGIVTGLIRHMSQAQIDASEIIDKAGKPIIDPENNKKTPQQAAATTVWCATSSQLNGMGGICCENCATPLARFLATRPSNYIACGSVQPIPLPRATCGSSASS